jgi:arylsulfatase/uncharacterized sulfatase
MRVPLMIAGAPVAAPGSITNAFAYVTDLAPTVLEFAGVALPEGEFAGRKVESISGKSLLSLVSGEVAQVHGPDEAIGYELGGNAALFKGRHKLVRDGGDIGDGEWHLFDIVGDPGETRDLKATQAAIFEDLRSEYARYVEANNVLPVPEGYSQIRQVMLNGMSKRLGPGFVPKLVAVAAIALASIGLAIRQLNRRARR